MAKGSRRKRVQFSEVRAVGGAPFEGVLDWEGAFSSLAAEEVKDTRHNLRGIAHWGRIYPWNERDHFILARLREDGVSQFDIENDEIVDQESQAAAPFVELTVISMVPGTNKFGVVRGSNASAHAVIFGEYINEHKLFESEVEVHPLISRQTQQKIQQADEVKMLDVKYDSHVSRESAVSGASGIASARNALLDDVGPSDVELVIKQKGRVNNSGLDLRRSLANTLRTVSEGMYSRAVAHLVHYDENGRPSQEILNLLNDVLAIKADVRVTDQEGNPVRIPSALQAIEKGMADLEEELAD